MTHTCPENRRCAVCHSIPIAWLYRGDCIITADASKVSPAEFFDMVFPGRPSREEAYARQVENCIRKIERGDSLYGEPAMTVADARRIMAERADDVAEDRLTVTRGDPMRRVG